LNRVEVARERPHAGGDRADRQGRSATEGRCVMRMRLTLLAVRLVPVLALLGTAAALLERTRYTGGYYLY